MTFAYLLLYRVVIHSICCPSHIVSLAIHQCAHVCSCQSLFFFSFSSEDCNRRRPQRNKDFKDRNLKPTLKLVLAVIILGTFLTLFFSPGVYHSDHQSRSVSQYVPIGSSPCFYLLVMVLVYCLLLSCLNGKFFGVRFSNNFPHLGKYIVSASLFVWNWKSHIFSFQANGNWSFFVLALFSLPWRFFVTKVYCLQPKF